MQKSTSILMIVLVIVSACLILPGCRRKSKTNESAKANPSYEIPPRTAPPVLVVDAGAPLLAGAVGVDADGYPKQYVETAVLRGMLLRKEYAQLNKVVADFQHDFEADPKREVWPNDAIPYSDDLKVIDAWILATPDSFVPYLSRAMAEEGIGFERRGDDLVKETSKEKLEGMQSAFEGAKRDVDKALSLHPNLAVAYQVRIRIGRALGDTALAERALADALAACPTCFITRSFYLKYSTPRWGGTYDKMAALAAKWAPVGPKMKLLPALIDLDKADLLERENKLDAALEAFDRACARGEYWSFLGARGSFHYRHLHTTKALADLDRALELRPTASVLMVQRAYVYFDLEQFENVGRNLREAFVYDPSNARAQRLLARAIHGLVKESEHHRQAGKREDALRVLDLAAELSPSNPEVTRQRSLVLNDASDAH